MGTEQIVHEECSQTLGLADITLLIHGTHYLIAVPVYLIHIGKEEVNILDGCTTVAPGFHRIVA